MREDAVTPQLYQQKEKCCGCQACANACPVDAISFKEDEYGFFYPEINKNKCIACHRCVQTCDFQKIDGVKKHYPLKCYAAVHKDKNILRKSTSGGIFSALSEIVFAENGVVFGCVLDKDLNPKHVYAENPAELAPMRGSKYVQSDTGYVYRKVKEFLKAGRKVLFSGTPCQIAGMYSYLGNAEQENLITVEIICHGTPSVGMFKAYVDYVEKKLNVKIADYHFRSKKRGWGLSDYHYDQEFSQDGKNYKKISASTPYISNFCKNNLCRSSCLVCKYAEPNRIADFTMGDFHAYQKVKVKSYPYRGLSIILFNSQKALSIYPKLSERMALENVSDIEAAIKTNGNLWRPSPKGGEWDFFMQAYAENRFDNAIKQYEEQNRSVIMKSKLKRLFPLHLHIFIRRIKDFLIRSKVK